MDVRRDYQGIAPGRMPGGPRDRIVASLYRRHKPDPYDPRGPETIGYQLRQFRGPTIYDNKSINTIIPRANPPVSPKPGRTL